MFNKNIKRILAKLNILLKSENIILLIGILSILPIIAISFYIHPSADDFNYNVIAKEFGYWDAQNWFYQNYNGRFFTTAILTLKIWVSGSFILYKLFPVCILFLLFYSLYNLFSILFPELYKKDYIVLTSYFFIIYLVQMPQISDGLYWLSGTVNYQLANILTVFFVTFIIKLLRTSKSKYLILSILFAFTIIGLNEIAMLSINFLLVSIIFYKYLNENKIYFKLLILLFFSVLFSVIVFNSPGNDIRSSSHLDRHQLLAFKQSLFEMKRQIEKWLPFIILITFIFFDYFRTKSHIKFSKIFKVNLIFAAFIVFCTVFIGFFTTYWAIGLPPHSRARNTIYFFFLIGIIYLSFILFFKLKSNNKIFISFSNWVKYLLLLLLYIFLTGDKPHINNVRSAYTDIISGNLRRYDQELKERYQLIKNCKKDTCYVPLLKTKPYTVYSWDITSDPKYIANKNYCSYYHPNKVIIGIK